jgi:hypothetical protein
MTKFLKIIWSINGVALLIFLLGVGYFASKELFRSYPDYDDDLIVSGKELEEAKSRGLTLQGLSYNTPIKLYGADIYILPVSANTFDEPKDNYYVTSDEAVIEGNYSLVNVGFLDKNL